MDDDLKLPKWARVEEAKKGQDGKECEVCKRWLTTGLGGTWRSFHRHKAQRDGLKRTCKECMGRYQTKNKHVMQRARKKYEIVHGRQKTLEREVGAKDRVKRFMATGVMEGAPSAKSAKEKLEAFMMGAEVYDWQKESD